MSIRRSSFLANLLVLCVVVMLIISQTVWPTTSRAGGQDEKEEKEDPKKPKRKPPKVDDEPGETKAVAPKAENKLAEDAERARDPLARQMFRELAVPYDRVTFLSDKSTRVQPVKDYLPVASKVGSKRWTFQPLPTERSSSPFGATSADIKGIEPYERIALDLVDTFIKRTTEDGGSSAVDQALARLARLQDAEKVLKVVINFHVSRRELNLRDDNVGWKALEKELRAKLRSVQLRQMEALAEAKDWDQAFALGVRLSEAYPNTRDIQMELGRLLARHAEQSLQDQDFKSALLRLQVLEEQFAENEDTRPIRLGLEKRAKQLLDEARTLVKEGKSQEATVRLRSAELAWPKLPGLRDYQLELMGKYPILYVGVTEMPEFLSPATAVLDSERMALDLLFESLVKLSPNHSAGPRYEPALADDRPTLVPLGRAFQISRKAYWSNGRRVTATDVSNTVDLLKSNAWPGHSHEWADLVRNAYVGGDPFQISLTLSQGYMDPLALLSFKVLPATEIGNRADNPTFARSPVGSGPYVLRRDNQKKQFVVFTANSQYGDRDGKRLGLPQIREIRFVKPTNAGADFRAGTLHLLPDVPSRDVQTLTSPELRGVLTVRTMPARRITFLAVNHRRQALQNEDLRRGLAHAIDRESILTECFRRGHAEWHKSLNGPYPPGSWAANPKLPVNLYKAGFAKTRFDEAAKAGALGGQLTLKYPEGNDAVREACERIVKQIQAVDNRVQIQLVARKMRDLHADVVERRDYDLAYFHHDFLDESFWLWPMFDQRTADVQGGQNYLGYRNDSTLASLFRGVIARRDIQEVRQLTHEIHERIYETMPIIPLWQLDRHIAVHDQLDVGTIDPVAVFLDVDRWELKNR